MQPLSPSDRALGDLLIARRVLTLPQLDEVIGLAQTWHVRLGDAILSRNWIDPAVYYQAVAFYYELPFVDLISETPDSSLLFAAEADNYARRLTLPWKRNDGKILIATAMPGPETVLFARQRWGSAIEFVVVSKFDIGWTLQTAFADEALSHRAVYELVERNPEMSAQKVFTPAQAVFAYTIFTALMLGLAYSPIATLIIVNVALSVFYLGNFVFKGILVSVGGARSANQDETIAIAARQLRDDDLPVFTVLVPMYREPEVLPFLINSLRNLDYPLGKLDIKLVLEAGDMKPSRPQAAGPRKRLPSHPCASVISEDQAEGLQLRTAVRARRVCDDLRCRRPARAGPAAQGGRDVPAGSRQHGCRQGRLNYYNADENCLTRMFTLEYSQWFDQMLPGSSVSTCRSRSGGRPTISRSKCCASSTHGIPLMSPRMRISASG